MADYYSTFFREYDPVIGRFNGVDPMSESFESWTTYHYSYNNPINFNDPMGDEANLGSTYTPPNMRDLVESVMASYGWGGGWLDDAGGGGGGIGSYNYFKAHLDYLGTDQWKLDMFNLRLEKAIWDLEKKLKKLGIDHDAVKKEFDKMINGKEYLKAIRYLTETYGFDKDPEIFDNSIVKITDDDVAVLITKGEVKTGALQTIYVSNFLLKAVTSGDLDFGAFVRGLGHEFLHVKQSAGSSIIGDHNERETLAYIYSLSSPADLPKIPDEDRKFWQKELKNYYLQLPLAKKNMYVCDYENALK